LTKTIDWGRKLYTGNQTLFNNRFKRRELIGTIIFTILFVIIILLLAILLLTWPVPLLEMIITLIVCIFALLVALFTTLNLFGEATRNPIKLFEKGIMKPVSVKDFFRWDNIFVSYEDIIRIEFYGDGTYHDYDIIATIYLQKDSEYALLKKKETKIKLDDFPVIIRGNMIDDPVKFKKLLLQKAEEYEIPVKFIKEVRRLTRVSN